MDKTAFAFLPFEVALVWHGCYGWVAQQIDLAKARAHEGDHVWALADERWFCYPACDNSMQSQGSALMAATNPQHLSHPPNLQSCRPENHHLSLPLSLKRHQQLPFFFFIYVSDSFYYTQWTLWFQLSLFITISNYRYRRLIHWNRPGENSLSIDYNESETGELMALGYQSHLSTSCHVSVLCTIILDCGQIVCMKIICI